MLMGPTRLSAVIKQYFRGVWGPRANVWITYACACDSLRALFMSTTQAGFLNIFKAAGDHKDIFYETQLLSPVREVFKAKLQ